MKDAEHPFFRPLWRRVAVVAFCAVWAAWEWWNANTLWATMVGALGAYGAWTFLLNYSPPPLPDAQSPAASADTKPAEKE
jgi:hypothetical protein